MVTVSKGGRTYKTPVMTGRVKWNGAGRVDIESTGNKKRDPLSKQSKDQYSNGVRGGGGYYGAKQGGDDHAWLEDTDDHVSLVAEKVFGNGDYKKIAELKVDPGGIHATVESNSKGVKEAKGRLDLTDRTFSVILEGNGEGAKIKAASIMAAINDDESEVCISADKIKLNGKTTINDVMRVSDVGVYITKTLLAGGVGLDVVAMSGGRLVANSINIRGAGGATSELKVLNVEPKGNELEITYTNGTKVNFSKAVTLTGKWDGGLRKFTVEASQTLKGKSVKVASTYTTLFQNLESIDWSAGYNAGVGMLKARIVSATGQTVTTNAGLITVDGSAAYSAGQATTPTVATNTSERPTGATDLRSELYISASIKTITIRIGSHLWYCKVST